jgi:hypothetical protein
VPSGIDRLLNERDDYKVKVIISYNIIRGTPYYKVKWYGWLSLVNI